MEELKLINTFLNYHVHIKCITGCSLQSKSDKFEPEHTTAINTSFLKKYQTRKQRNNKPQDKFQRDFSRPKPTH